MKKVNELHNKAMDLTEQALLLQRKQQQVAANQLFKEAFDLEKSAAMLMINKYEIEPTRSILFKSAACLALDINDYREAERMIAFALSGNPPTEITNELRGLSIEISNIRNDVEGIQPQDIIIQYSKLPNHLKKEAANFISYLVEKHSTVYR